jgi:ribosomal protein L28
MARTVHSGLFLRKKRISEVGFLNPSRHKNIHMGTAEATISRRQFAANISRAAGQTPRRRLANLLRKYHLIKPEPTSGELCKIALKKAIEEAGMMNLDAALEMAGKALGHEPNDMQATVIKGMLYMDSGMAGMAETEFRKAVETARKMSSKENHGILQLDYSSVTDYIDMRRESPAGDVQHIAYVPIGEAIVSLSISAFGQAEKDFGFAVRFSTEKQKSKRRCAPLSVNWPGNGA